MNEPDFLDRVTSRNVSDAGTAGYATGFLEVDRACTRWLRARGLMPPEGITGFSSAMRWHREQRQKATKPKSPSTPKASSPSRP